MNDHLIATVAIAIGNKLAENGISISLTLAPEIAKAAIKVMRNLNYEAKEEYRPKKFIEEIDKVLNKWSMKIYVHDIGTDEYVPLRIDSHD